MAEHIFTIEPHGKPGNFALYSGRDNHHHGLRLCNINDLDMNGDKTLKMIEDALNYTQTEELPPAPDFGGFGEPAAGGSIRG